MAFSYAPLNMKGVAALYRAATSLLLGGGATTFPEAAGGVLLLQVETTPWDC